MDALWSKITTALVQPFVALLFAAALFYFFWGILRYTAGADNPEARSAGNNHMIWGIIGLAIMITVFGLMRVLCNTIDCN